ncbi:MAG TPA: endopeptidase, partial [Vicinamibacteria bacterium]|nr:endopeptidase [Vicinamibacteria bacterium]
MKVLNDLGSWEALVDAGSGEVLLFEDKNQYAVRRIIGGVYPVSNDQRPPDGVEQQAWPMPFANVTIGGNTVISTAGGTLGCATGTATTALAGPFIRMNDNCGAINETAAGDLDLGFGPTPAATDCTVPAGHSVGDTKSSRSGFYELNRIVEQAKGYLPANTWLASQVTSNMNINLTCNAFWNGSTVNFYRDNGSQCRNTGEIAAIFDHEWGHGMDNNGTNPTISQPGEGIADIHAFLRLQTSCIGRGFWKNQTCTGYGDGCNGTPATGCTGIRDIDYTQRRCNRPHTVTYITQGFTSAQCGGGAAVPPCPAGGGTPCSRATHCEGSIVGETAFDLVRRDLTAAPFSLDSNTAHELGTRLF